MFLAYKLYCLELLRHDCLKIYLKYRKILRKSDSHSLRINFLDKCLKANIIPRFLKFRVPTNGCFDDRSVHDFQIRLLRKELFKAKVEHTETSDKLSEIREKLKQKLQSKCITSVILHSRYDLRIIRQKQNSKLNDKLQRLSKE